MYSSDLEAVRRFRAWLSVGDYILRQAASVPGELPQGPVVFVLRAAGVSVAALRRALPGVEIDGDLLYVGYSEDLGDHPTGRLHNMRGNDQTTNVRIREGVARIIPVPGARVELGWRPVGSLHEARELRDELKREYRRQYGHHLPLNRSG